MTVPILDTVERAIMREMQARGEASLTRDALDALVQIGSTEVFNAGINSLRRLGLVAEHRFSPQVPSQVSLTGAGRSLKIEGDTLPDPPPPPNTPGSPTDPVFKPYLYSVATLTISDGEIFGIDLTSKFGGAFIFDVGVYCVLFAEPLADTSYLAKAYGSEHRTFVRETDKFTDSFIITCVDEAGAPVDVETIAVEIVKVQ